MAIVKLCYAEVMAVHAIAGDLGQGVVRFSTVLAYILSVSHTQPGKYMV
jgi:hypothetical protein